MNPRKTPAVSVKGRRFKSGPAHQPRSHDVSSKILNTIWQLKKEGYADSTLKAYDSRLRGLSRHVNLEDPEVVKSYIASKDTWKNAFKEGVARAYNHYVRHNGLSWKKPKYKYSKKLPYIATTEQINKIISNCRKKYALILSILGDTGLRPIELHRLTMRDIDLERGTISVSARAHFSQARIIRTRMRALAITIISYSVILSTISTTIAR